MVTEDFDEGENFSKFSDFYIPLEEIGSGAFGKVVRVRDKQTDHEYAVKVIRKSHVREIVNAVRKEAELLAKLNHPNVVRFRHVRETERRIFIGMDLIRGGQLKKLMERRENEGRGFTDKEASVIIRGVLRALKYLHANDIVHRDLKPDNILLDDEENLSTVRLVDFGLSAQFDKESRKTNLKDRVGTASYMAPEYYKNSTYAKPVDMWSCGILMYTLRLGKHPYYIRGDSYEALKRKVENPTWTFSKEISEMAKKFFLKLMAVNPFERYTAEQAFDHPWITRDPHSEIPLTVNEMLSKFSVEQNLRKVIKRAFLISKIFKQATGKEISYSYSQQLDDVSSAKLHDYKVQLGDTEPREESDWLGTSTTTSATTTTLSNFSQSHIAGLSGTHKLIFDSPPFRVHHKKTASSGDGMWRGRESETIGYHQDGDSPISILESKKTTFPSVFGDNDHRRSMNFSDQAFRIRKSLRRSKVQSMNSTAKTGFGLDNSPSTSPRTTVRTNFSPLHSRKHKKKRTVGHPLATELVKSASHIKSMSSKNLDLMSQMHPCNGLQGATTTGRGSYQAEDENHLGSPSLKNKATRGMSSTNGNYFFSSGSHNHKQQDPLLPHIGSPSREMKKIQHAFRKHSFITNTKNHKRTNDTKHRRRASELIPLRAVIEAASGGGGGGQLSVNLSKSQSPKKFYNPSGANSPGLTKRKMINQPRPHRHIL